MPCTLESQFRIVDAYQLAVENISRSKQDTERILVNLRRLLKTNLLERVHVNLQWICE